MSRKQKPIRKDTTAGAARPKSPADVFQGHSEGVRRLAQQLRQLVFQTLPDLNEAAYGGAKVRLTLFSLGSPQNVICGVRPGADGCLFYFHHVTPEDSSVLKIEGKGKHARHVKVDILDGPTLQEISRLLLLARRRGG